MELVGLLNSMGYKTSVDGDGVINVEKQGTFDNWFSNKKRDNDLDYNSIQVLSLLST